MDLCNQLRCKSSMSTQFAQIYDPLQIYPNQPLIGIKSWLLEIIICMYVYTYIYLYHLIYYLFELPCFEALFFSTRVLNLSKTPQNSTTYPQFYNVHPISNNFHGSILFLCIDPPPVFIISAIFYAQLLCFLPKKNKSLKNKPIVRPNCTHYAQ